MERVSVTVRARSGSPDDHETPLDDGVERLKGELYYSEVDELLKHSAKSSASIGHGRLLSAGCPNLRDSVPPRYRRPGGVFTFYSEERSHMSLDWDNLETPAETFGRLVPSAATGGGDLLATGVTPNE